LFMTTRSWHPRVNRWRSERDLAAALELQNLPRLVGRCDVQSESFDEFSNLGHLVGILMARARAVKGLQLYSAGCVRALWGGRRHRMFVERWVQVVNLWKSGVRFSLKAATPSFDSAVS
jgi:hypothetical protein